MDVFTSTYTNNTEYKSQESKNLLLTNNSSQKEIDFSLKNYYATRHNKTRGL